MVRSRNDGNALEPWSDPAAEPYVRISGVTKRFGDFAAVNDVSLDIYKGEIFCLLGGSGCGKSTLLRMLAGFETPSAGSVVLDAQDLAAIPPYQRPVNMMFQSYALFPHMTVEKNIAFGLEQEHLPKAQIAERVSQMLSIVRLTEYAKRRPHQLSGGQKQRVALARALVKRPKLLLLDEPLGALDRKLREHTQFELINIQQQLGVTFIVVTHDQEEAMTLASRIGVMNHGQIVQIGTPSQIYEAPNSKFVADFIGSVNLFEGRLIEAQEGQARIQCDELGGVVHVDYAVDASPGQSVCAAIRPERIHLLREPPEHTGENCVRGVVREIAYMGDMSIYLVQADGGKVVRVTQPNIARVTHGQRIEWDEQVYLTWRAGSPVVLTR
ncbi:MAG: polyamine ABC transporter ATP-binding protein [Nevskiaceae bacterium]|jgi:putrescine transport system ATP-binding protein|nr:polyamine ABC transporter ATP-binding protein [Nevskiaceae bacterium]